jgi:wyosine [tRNA(Phe)-imidazoG37] synthetase (radical SAM superfamily)
MRKWVTSFSRKMKQQIEYTYGPVPSRRLGFSLGIDVIPFKHCTFDCIYCQLGKTTNRTIVRAEYTPACDIIREIEQALIIKRNIDYLTFSGSGEPTLHARLGYLITTIKRLSEIPVAVLTNGSLMFLPGVRDDLGHADVVAPTLCAATDEMLQRINQPMPGITLEKIIQGLIDFRRMYRGALWLEVMLVQDMNDADEHIEKLITCTRKIAPDKIHLNTVVRPPREKKARPVPLERLEAIKHKFGERCEIIAGFKKQAGAGRSGDQYADIINVIRRRPVTLDDIVRFTNIHPREILKYLEQMVSDKKIRYADHEGIRYYESNEVL